MVPVENNPSIQQKMSLMKGWTTEVVIHAPRQLVWEQVTDFETYSEWNPFVIEAKAEFAVGATIHFLEDLKQFGRHWIDAQFLSIAPPDSFVWQGHVAAPFLFTVCHRFIFEAISEHQTRFVQIHENSGLLIPYLAWRGIYLVSHQGYLDYNQALKERCER
ncbi:SRPBCC domain-containing protein [Leptolyngbya cf. ectocarpi LEGE 11479]|uniref:SRPBCC domain-containing protein n=1 Tax=Leptolyngbya cf. ectocarpi LEGE 11479 TaxID=1828722 RepID=A0A928ZZ73_LEPEC|nr:SRPBCC domain-containing protein [Leptolyngbya ectocarpi]MBE9070126.1 SRPBCC domain-containing protein [Leptolyngbya cf. ectocarpi LEGE 11479]